MVKRIFAGSVSAEAGTADAAAVGAQGTLHINVTPLGSSATDTTQTLMSYTVPANALDANTRGLLVTAWGTFAGNAAPKTMELNFGGVNINSGSVTQSGSTWIMTARVFRVASASQQIVFQAQLGSVITAAKSTTDTSVDTGTIAITTKMIDASAAQSNVIQKGLQVVYFQ